MGWINGPDSPPRVVHRSSSNKIGQSHSNHSTTSHRSNSHHDGRSSPTRSSSYHYQHEQSRKDEKPQYSFSRPHVASTGSTSRGWGASSGSSSSRARPRSGYINKMVYQVRYYLRKLYHYARRNPVKLFMLVIMPLITGGALADLLRRFGIRLPGGLQNMLPGGGGRRSGFDGGRSGGMEAGGVAGLMKLAQMFI